MIYRMAGSHFTLLFITLGILLGCAGIMTKQVDFLATNYQMDFIPDEINLEENIAILIAAFGVFLEHRSYLLNLIYPDGLPEPVAQFDQYSHNAGVMFIFVAILVVAIDLFFLALNTWGVTFATLKFLEISVLFGINLLTFLMFIVFGFRAIQRYPG